MTAILKDYITERRYSRTHRRNMIYGVGRVYNDERFEDGSEITTTAIIGKEGSVITTTSGNKYIIEPYTKYENITS